MWRGWLSRVKLAITIHTILLYHKTKPHHGFFLGLLNGVPSDFTVSIVFWRFPLQGHVEAPDIYDFQRLWWTWKVYKDGTILGGLVM